MANVKQHTHLIREVIGEEKNTYECVFKQQDSRKIANVRFNSPKVLYGWTRLPFLRWTKKLGKEVELK